MNMSIDRSRLNCVTTIPVAMCRVVVCCGLLMLTLGCRQQLKPEDTCPATIASNDVIDCPVPGHPQRAYTLYAPELKTNTPVPLLVTFHGGGGNRLGALKTTCPNGNLEDPQCLHNLALKRGVAVLSPDGTSSRVLLNSRTWNAGGGVDGYRCTSGQACALNVDEYAFMQALLKDLKSRINIDTSKVYATGLSNGGAMSYRMACQMSDVFAAIAPVGGAMSWSTSHDCKPSRPVPILHVHGTADPCWRYEGGVPNCPTGQKDKKHVSVTRTINEWVALNGCTDATSVSRLPDTVDDGMFTERISHVECKAPVELLKIHKGGHTWPSGQQYFSEKIVGGATRDWGNAFILDWLTQFSLKKKMP